MPDAARVTVVTISAESTTGPGPPEPPGRAPERAVGPTGESSIDAEGQSEAPGSASDGNPGAASPEESLGAATSALVLVVVAAAVTTSWSILSVHPPQLALDTLVMMVLGALLAKSSLRIGDSIHLSAAHPLIFAAVALERPETAILVAFTNTLAPALYKRQYRSPFKVVFNCATAVTCAALGYWVYQRVLPAGAVRDLETQLVPVVAASLSFFVINATLVAAVMSLSSGVGLLRGLRESTIWLAPSYLAGGVVGLLLAHCLNRLGSLAVVLSLPFFYLIFSSYRLHVLRLKEREERLTVTERLNADLESKVLERTDDYLKLNERLEQTVVELTESNRARSEFVASISHELRTPLNAIMGFSDVLLRPSESDLSTKHRRYASNINTAGASLLTLINDLLDISKIEAGKMELRLREWPPIGIIHETLALVEVLATNKDIKLRLSLADGPPKMLLDPVRLRQVMWNLLSNAIKFTPNGGQVGVEQSQHNGEIFIVVWDTGCGIASDEIEKVFDRFYQVERSYNRSHNGTGLGLALVKELVEMHGGVVSVDSELGVGSRFEVRIPIRLAEVEIKKGGPYAAVSQ